MISEVKKFVEYLERVKGASQNTQVSYCRDLTKMVFYLNNHGITEVLKVTSTSLTSYILFLEKEGKSTATISRVIASLKAFFSFELALGLIIKNPAESLKAPKIEKKAPVILTVDEINCLLNQPNGIGMKEVRDKAMLELLYATGIRVSELIHLKVMDVNLDIGFITCRDQNKERVIPFGKPTKQALVKYLENSREYFLKGNSSEWLFTNCNGQAMSRQGFWKIIKFYGDKAGIQMDITPHTLRHSFAAHLIRAGADIQAVQNMMGHSDMATTQVYTSYIKRDDVRRVYLENHPRR